MVVGNKETTTMVQREQRVLVLGQIRGVFRVYLRWELRLKQVRLYIGTDQVAQQNRSKLANPLSMLRHWILVLQHRTLNALGFRFKISCRNTGTLCRNMSPNFQIIFCSKCHVTALRCSVTTRIELKRFQFKSPKSQHGNVMS